MSAKAPLPTQTFDPVRYKESTREQWQRVATAWYRWGPAIQTWLGPATEAMLDLAEIGPGSRVLDVVAGPGEPALTAAERVGPAGYVLATDISMNIDHPSVSGDAAGSNATARAARPSSCRNARLVQFLG